MSIRQLVPLAVVLSALACASSGTSTPRTSRDVITAEEIEATEATTAYDVVQRLRPEFLRGRSGTITPPVYVDGVRQGEISYLHTIPRSMVIEIRYLGASDATTRFGTGHTGGAILIRTRR